MALLLGDRVAHTQPVCAEHTLSSDGVVGSSNTATIGGKTQHQLNVNLNLIYPVSTAHNSFLFLKLNSTLKPLETVCCSRLSILETVCCSRLSILETVCCSRLSILETVCCSRFSILETVCCSRLSILETVCCSRLSILETVCCSRLSIRLNVSFLIYMYIHSKQATATLCNFCPIQDSPVSHLTH